jgi:hypothetical protein
MPKNPMEWPSSFKRGAVQQGLGFGGPLLPSGCLPAGLNQSRQANDRERYLPGQDAEPPEALLSPEGLRSPRNDEASPKDQTSQKDQAY